MLLRTHQLECVDSIKTHFTSNSSCLVKMFCGSGKSFVIYHCLLEFGNNLSVVVVPSINLITQFNKDYLMDHNKKLYNKKNFNKHFKLLTICSKNELVIDDNHVFTFTSDSSEILEFLNIKKNKIILITYQSLEKLFNIIHKHNFTIDLISFDEAHHITSSGMKKLLFGLDDLDLDLDLDLALNSKTNSNSNSKTNSETNSISDSDPDYDSNYSSNYDSDSDANHNINFINNHVKKTIYFTATPKNSNEIKMYEPVISYDIGDEYYEIIEEQSEINDSDITHCGKMVYEYMHLDGVQDNILNDFNIRIDLYTQKTTQSIFESISRSIIETGNNRVLTFHSRSEISSDKGSDVISFTTKTNKKIFMDCFNKVLKEEFVDKIKKYSGSKINLVGITSNTKNRNKILEQFDNTNETDIFVLSSCKTIGEGVDTSNANMVVFIDPKQSYVEIIQNIGRICRKNANTKQNATILIPTFVDTTKYKNCKSIEQKDQVIRNEMSKTGDFNGILNVLSAIRQEDPYLFELCLKYPDIYTQKEISSNLKKYNLKLDLVLDSKTNLETNQTYSIVELFDQYKIKYNEKKTQIENFTNFSSSSNSNVQVISNKILENDIYIGSDFKDTIYFVKTDDDKYIKTIPIDLDSQKIKISDKIPKPNRNIKPITHINDEIKVLWEIDTDINLNKKVFGGYIKSVVQTQTEEEWIVKLNEIKNYINLHGYKPSSTDKNGRWLFKQKKLYGKKLGIFKKYKKIILEWEKFVNEYKKYFKSNEEVWMEKLEQVKSYINLNGIKPSSSDKNTEVKLLGKWIGTQQQNYEKKKFIMSNENIRSQWEKFIDEYKKYFKSNEEVWMDKLEQVKSYINLNDTKPSSSDKNTEVKLLGSWIGTQQKNYEKKEFIMSDENIRSQWKKFIDEYKKYFKSNEEVWIEKLEQVKSYINLNDIKPSSSDKNIEVKLLGKWIETQQHNYKKKIL